MPVYCATPFIDIQVQLVTKFHTQGTQIKAINKYNVGSDMCIILIWLDTYVNVGIDIFDIFWSNDEKCRYLILLCYKCASKILLRHTYKTNLNLFTAVAKSKVSGQGWTNVKWWYYSPTLSFIYVLSSASHNFASSCSSKGSKLYLCKQGDNRS